MGQNQPYIMPFTRVVGQQDLKLALALYYINPRIGGVLIEGERGTAKSTLVRAFSQMMHKKLPITLPINATEDRVVGSWQLDKLLKSDPQWQDGLLQQADKGFLYVDEVNLLDDHIVNLLLDAASTGILVIQRDGYDQTVPVSFGLIGTMNPEEGSLRPQLLDRFGMCVSVKAERSAENRRAILEAILTFDEDPQSLIGKEENNLTEERERIEGAKRKIEAGKVAFPEETAELCIRIAREYRAEGHRGDHVLALAAQALAALEGGESTEPLHLQRVAPMALQHRLIDPDTRERLAWNPTKLNEIFDQVA